MTHRGAARLKVTAALALVTAIAATGCLQSTDPQPPTIPLIGSWRYTGTQTGAIRETLLGTLVIGRQSGSAFQGSVDLVATNVVTGEARVLNGTLSGVVASSDAVDFDVSVELTPRRHVGQLVGDTITGSWVGTAAGGGTVSGVFRAERRP
jgi:hypothetical protein